MQELPEVQTDVLSKSRLVFPNARHGLIEPAIDLRGGAAHSPEKTDQASLIESLRREFPEIYSLE